MRKYPLAAITIVIMAIVISNFDQELQELPNIDTSGNAEVPAPFTIQVHNLLPPRAQGMFFLRPAYGNELLFYDLGSEVTIPLLKFSGSLANNNFPIDKNLTHYPEIYIRSSKKELFAYSLKTGDSTLIPIPPDGTSDTVFLPSRKILYLYWDPIDPTFHLYDRETKKDEVISNHELVSEISQHESLMLDPTYNVSAATLEFVKGFWEFAGGTGIRFRLHLKTGEVEKLAEASRVGCTFKLEITGGKPCSEEELEKDRQADRKLFPHGQFFPSQFRCAGVSVEEVQNKEKILKDASYVGCAE